jgi:hypothetical protein
MAGIAPGHLLVPRYSLEALSACRSQDMQLKAVQLKGVLSLRIARKRATFDAGSASSGKALVKITINVAPGDVP